jgi:WhiB family transcriptional regulator, redox-sensing transcriptional regulator
MKNMAVRIPGDWWELAACQAADPDLFFPISGQGRAKNDMARARAVCQQCQVRTKCLDYALATRQVDGIWGGLTETERQPLFASGAHGDQDERSAA